MCHYITRSFARSFTFFIFLKRTRSLMFFKFLYLMFATSMILTHFTTFTVKFKPRYACLIVFDSHLELLILAAILKFFCNYSCVDEFLGSLHLWPFEYLTYHMTSWLLHKMRFYHLHKLSTILEAVHKVCHAIFDFLPPVTNCHKSWTP